MQDILVHATNFTSWTAAMIRAARLAAAFDGSLTGAYVCPSPAIGAMTPYGGADIAAAIVESIRQHESRAAAARESFETRAAAYGATRAVWQVAEGDVPQVLQHLGNSHDLLVLGRGDEGPWEKPGGLGSVILTAGVPSLIVPNDSPDEFSTECIALAWNGAPEGLRAIHAARPLLARAKRIVLLRGRRRDRYSEIGWRPEFSIDDYCARHGWHVESHTLDADDESAGAALLDAARAAAADLLVMGAYGRPRFSEWMFGGATRHVLQHAAMPVLFRH